MTRIQDEVEKLRALALGIAGSGWTLCDELRGIADRIEEAAEELVAILENRRRA